MELSIQFTPKEMELIELMGETGGIYAECRDLVKLYRINPAMDLSTGQLGILKVLKRNVAYKVAHA